MAGAQRIQSDLRGPPWSSIFLSVKILLVFGGSGRSPDCRGAAEYRLSQLAGPLDALTRELAEAGVRAVGSG
jgi:hypothetical protein